MFRKNISLDNKLNTQLFKALNEFKLNSVLECIQHIDLAYLLLYSILVHFLFQQLKLELAPLSYHEMLLYA